MRRIHFLALKLAVGTITSSDGGSIDDASAVVVLQDPAAGETKSDTVVNLTVAAKQKAKKNGTVNISIPKGGNPRQVDILVTDDNGRHPVYSAKANPGEHRHQGRLRQRQCACTGHHRRLRRTGQGALMKGIILKNQNGYFSIAGEGSSSPFAVRGEG